MDSRPWSKVLSNTIAYVYFTYYSTTNNPAKQSTQVRRQAREQQMQ